MAKKNEKLINGRFREPERPGASIFWWGFSAFLLLGTIVLAIPCGYKCVKNAYRRSLAKRFSGYARAIGMRERITVHELTVAVQGNPDSVKRDLQKMIDMGWFGEDAFLNMGEGTLFVPIRRTFRETWQDALKNLFREMRRDGVNESSKQTEPPRKPAAEPEPAPAPKKTAHDSYIEEMERTLAQLNDLNEKIADEAVSARIDRIGMLTAGIFRVVIENPKRESDVRRFMNYYLPTTLKLLKAYDLLEDDGVQSQSIIESRQKIERVLDKLIEAFEQLYERLHTAETLDLDADVEVLETMMAGDGLSRKGNIRMQSH